MLRELIALLLAVLVAPAFGAGIYKWTEPDGTTVYSDQPAPGAEEIRKTEIQTVPAQPLPLPAATDEQTSEFKGYELIEVLTPENEATVRDNTGNVPVTVALTPNLQSNLGHSLVLLLDEVPYGQPSASTSFMLENVDRGSHTVRASVVDKEGREVASSEPVTFHLHRTSVLLPRANKPKT